MTNKNYKRKDRIRSMKKLNDESNKNRIENIKKLDE